MSPFVRELSGKHRSRDMSTAAVADLRRVELVAPLRCLVQDSREVAVDRGHRIPAPTKALELGMVAVAPGVTQQNGARQEPLAPQSNEPTGVQASGM
jgi:hypothetical protein